MVPVALSDVIAVGEVPSVDEIRILANAGFRSILLTQPDGEVDRLIPSRDVESHAKAASLAFRFIPIESRRPSDSSVEAFRQALTHLPRPIYACCYSGARTAAVWALAAVPPGAPDDAISACRSAGYDIEFMRPQLEARAAAPTPTPAPAVALVANGRSNGTANGHANGVAASDTSLPAIPALLPKDQMPRAASAGGFAVPG